MLSLVVATVLGLTVQEHLSGAEIGDAVQFVAFKTGGRYYAERKDGRVKSVARGAWKVDGDKLTVTVASCNGPSCPTLGRPFTARVRLFNPNAMGVVAEPSDAPLSSGAYYCLSQGCEKRAGVEVVTHSAPSSALEDLVERLTDDPSTRDSSVAWVGAAQRQSQSATSVEYCPAFGESARRAAQAVAEVVSQAPGMGRAAPREAAAGCQSEVRVIVGDAVRSAQR